jgi:hypothetical protein
MMIPEDGREDKADRTLEPWIHEESLQVAQETLERLSPVACRSAGDDDVRHH